MVRDRSNLSGGTVLWGFWSGGGCRCGIGAGVVSLVGGWISIVVSSRGGVTPSVLTSSFSSSGSVIRSDVRVASACTWWFVLVHSFRAGNEIRQAYDSCLGSYQSFKLCVSSRAQQGSVVEVSGAVSYDMLS